MLLHTILLDFSVRTTLYTSKQTCLLRAVREKYQEHLCMVLEPHALVFALVFALILALVLDFSL